MDEELRQAIEAAKEQQPVAIDLGWYQGTVQHIKNRREKKESKLTLPHHS